MKFDELQIRIRLDIKSQTNVLKRSFKEEDIRTCLIINENSLSD